MASPMRHGPTCLTILALAGLLALDGCGSQSSTDPSRQAISSIRAVVTRYDRTQTTDLASTGLACAEAVRALARAGHGLQQQSVSAQDRSIVTAVRQAYASARRGFSDCASAAQALNYPLMDRADQEIAQANAWIARARRLDH